jgi:hypothetical protein
MMDQELPPYYFHGRLTGTITVAADSPGHPVGRAVGLELSLLFRMAGAQLQVTDIRDDPAGEAAFFELPADLSSQLLALMLGEDR